MSFNQSATRLRQWSPTVNTTGTVVKFTITGLGGASTLEKAKAVLFCHDGTSGDPDLYISLKGEVPGAPSDGGEIITLKGGETIRFDVETSQVALVAASGSVAARVIGAF